MACPPVHQNAMLTLTGKVVGLLHAYACVCTNVRFSVKHAMPKGKSMVVFATKANSSTRDNIANVYGAKTLHALVPLDLELDFQATLTQISQKDAHNTYIKVNGHISRPVWGEGRQTPDRQMFFVNGRPCGLPQVAKAMNEVYKSFNVSQSPFIFADFQMDTNAYDVNVSPDKRTILLHNATGLIEKLRESLTALFERQDQTVPQSQVAVGKLPAFKQLSMQKAESAAGEDAGANIQNLLHDHFRAQASTREEPSTKNGGHPNIQKDREKRAEKVANAIAAQAMEGIDEYDDVHDIQRMHGKTNYDTDDDDNEENPVEEVDNVKVRDFNERMAEQQVPQQIHEPSLPEASPDVEDHDEPKAVLGQNDLQDHPSVVQDAFDRMRPQRPVPEVATITIGDKITTKIVGSSQASHREPDSGAQQAVKPRKPKSASTIQFSQSLRKFGAPGTQLEEENETANLNSADDEDKEAPGGRPLLERTRKSSTGDSDSDYVDEAEKRAEEDARVAELIRLAEESVPTQESLNRANKVLRASTKKDSTGVLLSYLDLTLDALGVDAVAAYGNMSDAEGSSVEVETRNELDAASDEEKLSLTVARTDFAEMEIIGQFNLGFVLAVRKASNKVEGQDTQAAKLLNDELFIIDQHASDEKYNFERLQANTIVGNQRLVHPIILDLTAVEEEIVLENMLALEKNGFIVEADTSGSSPVGQRCKLLTLPLSKEVTFNTRDLDELIHLLAESPTLNEESQVPRPAKVRKMFAMRACRSSIMIGKTLSKRQMTEVLRHMGEIDKPWNCPHGRPTMRHLTSLDVLGRWTEGNGLAGERTDRGNVWKEY